MKKNILKPCVLLSLCLIFAFSAQAKVKAPFSLSAVIISGPTLEGEVEIEVRASSHMDSKVDLRCKYGKLKLIEGHTPLSFLLSADKSRTITYRFQLPSPEKRYKVWFTLRAGRGMAVKAVVDINKPDEEPAGKVKRLPSGEGVRELGP
jgi:hypothetical protein